MNNVFEIASNILIAIGLLFSLFGIIGIFRLNDFYSRILVSAKIDTVGAITLIAGVALKHGLSYFTLKLALLVVVMIILNPLANHMVARSAYLSEYKLEDGQIKDEHDEEEVA